MVFVKATCFPVKEPNLLLLLLVLLLVIVVTSKVHALFTLVQCL